MSTRLIISLVKYSLTDAVVPLPQETGSNDDIISESDSDEDSEEDYPSYQVEPLAESYLKNITVQYYVAHCLGNLECHRMNISTFLVRTRLSLDSDRYRPST